MECTHLGRAVDISPSFVKKLIEDNRNLWMCNGRNLFFSYIFLKVHLKNSCCESFRKHGEPTSVKVVGL